MTKILLVEDDKSLREIYGVRLLAEGYDIVSAGDGEEALAMAIKEKPTLIISDVMMPKISGFDMLDILRSTTETRDIKVIMMTALSSEDQRSRGEQLGADRYLVKSQVGIEDVVRTVHEVLGDTPGTTDVPAAPPQTPPSTTEESTDKPAEAAPAAEETSTEPKPADVTEDKPEETPASTPTEPTPESTATSSPGNEDAGPLPPQPLVTADPSESTESTLPQPTAPFSSPRPANLGERVIQPLGGSDVSDVNSAPAESTDTPSAAELSDKIAQELKAPAEPVAGTQVDEPVSTDATSTLPPIAPAVDLSAPSTTPQTDTPADPTPPADSTAAPTDPLAPPVPAADESSTPGQSTTPTP